MRIICREFKKLRNENILMVFIVMNIEKEKKTATTGLQHFVLIKEDFDFPLYVYINFSTCTKQKQKFKLPYLSSNVDTHKTTR